MKKCKNYNMKTEFEKPRDFDFKVNRVVPRFINGTRETILVPVGFFSLFGVSVIEARAICKKISSTTNYICTANLITE